MPPEDAHPEPVPAPAPEAPPGREPVLLTPFRLPAQSALYLGNEDVACFLNGYLALWHPAVLLRASTLPRTESPYDHEQPAGSHLYALPENPPLMLPDEWEERARAAGEVYFRATPERPSTLANRREALFAHCTREGAAPDAEMLALLDLPAERLAPFFGIGFGCAQLAALCDAMSHDLVLDTVALIGDLQEAARALLAESGAEAATQALKAAADKLMAAREVLYPVTIHLIDLALLTRNNLDQPLPVALDHGSPLTVLAPSLQLGAWADAHPDELQKLRRAVAEDRAEVVGGNAVEREDVLLPLESQLWNLEAGEEMAREVTGAPVKVHGRQRFGAGPLTPSLLQAAGLTRTLLVAFDEASLPAHRSPTVSWPAVDGKQVDAFCRAPHAADNPQTFFHVAHHLHETIMQDQTATLVLAHTRPACPWYDDWLALSRLAPVLGTWTTLSRYFDDTSLGDYTQPAPADEFHADHLSERTGDAEASAATYGYSSGGSSKLLTVGATEESRRHPVSAFAAHARSRRKLDPP